KESFAMTHLGGVLLPVATHPTDDIHKSESSFRREKVASFLLPRGTNSRSDDSCSDHRFGCSGGTGWVDQFDADGDDAKSFALGRIDLADVGQLLLARGQRVDRGDFLV